MSLINTASAVKELKGATPTVDNSGKVTSWKIELEYSLNDYVSNFSDTIKIEEPSKAPSDYTKTELLALANTAHLDEVFESQYTSVKLPEPATETTVSDFDFNTLA